MWLMVLFMGWGPHFPRVKYYTRGKVLCSYSYTQIPIISFPIVFSSAGRSNRPDIMLKIELLAAVIVTGLGG